MKKKVGCDDQLNMEKIECGWINEKKSKIIISIMRRRRRDKRRKRRENGVNYEEEIVDE